MPLKVTKVCCQGCGADLEVDETLRFVTCNYCNARLEIVHDTSVTHTRILDRIEKNTRQLAGNLKVIELQNDLERLDREWDRQRESLMTRGKDGSLSPPSAIGAILGGGVAAIAALMILLNTSSMSSPGPFGGGSSGILPLIGIGILIFAAFATFHGLHKAGTYNTMERRYEMKRDQLCQLINRARLG